MLLVELIDQWICELEVSFLHLWSQSICDLVTEGIGGENKLFANVVVWLNKIILELEKLSRNFLGQTMSVFDVYGYVKYVSIEQNSWSSSFCSVFDRGQNLTKTGIPDFCFKCPVSGSMIFLTQNGNWIRCWRIE